MLAERAEDGEVVGVARIPRSFRHRAHDFLIVSEVEDLGQEEILELLPQPLLAEERAVGAAPRDEVGVAGSRQVQVAHEGAAAAVDPLEGPLTKEATPGEKGLPVAGGAERPHVVVEPAVGEHPELVVRLLLRGELVDLRVGAREQLLRVALAVGEVEGPPQVDCHLGERVVDAAERLIGRYRARDPVVEDERVAAPGSARVGEEGECVVLYEADRRVEQH